MVFQEETVASRFWPFRLPLSHSSKGDKGCDEEAGRRTADEGHKDNICGECRPALSRREEAERLDREVADCLEQGMAREILTEFAHPLRKANKLFKFRIERSGDRCCYHLRTDRGKFLMFARASVDARRVDFYTYDPQSPSKSPSLYDAAKPAFTMTFSEDQTEWSLTQQRCESCQRRHVPEHLSCTALGKQQLAFVRHTSRRTCDGKFNSMDVQIPGFSPDGRSEVWCPVLGDRGSLAAASAPAAGAERLVTRFPEWNEEVKSLVLDFKSRAALPSARNFQLAHESSPKSTICQYVKIGPDSFGLDFRHPLSAVQAFGISMTTLVWQ